MPRLLPRSLTSRLVVTAVALVAVVSLLIGAVTTLGMRAWLMDRLDNDVRAAVDRVPGRGALPRFLPDDMPDRNGPSFFGEPHSITAVFSGRGRARLRARRHH